MDYHILFVLVTLFGLWKIAEDSFRSIRRGRYSLDYIAFVAMGLSLYSGEFGAGAVIALMYVGGKELEGFASRRAHEALRKLGDTIPKTCLVEQEGAHTSTKGIAAGSESLREMPIQKIAEGQVILVKRNEIVPLDGTLLSPETGIFNLANLTGEPGPAEIECGTFVKSGAINAGETVLLRVVGDFASSSYQKIVGLVETARAHPSPLVRLSERANIYFTFAAFAIAVATYLLTGDIARLLAVLVIATPCPLIIAAPVAFVGGMSRAARRGIILRKPAALEGIDAASTVLFDKTGTLTLGEPVLLPGVPDEMLSLAAGLEIHSLHPLARSIVGEARKRNLHFPISEKVHEEAGKGISGTIRGERYSFSGMSLSKEGRELARFQFDDVLKDGAEDFIAGLQAHGIRAAIITGDKRERALRVFDGVPVDIHAEQAPEDKYRFVEEEQKRGRVVMVGDGINDAPALAKADVGVVFSGTENGAVLEAADAVILGGGLEKLRDLFRISSRTVQIARQSIYGGIALSVIGMGFAAFGLISPVQGALLQECIDIAVILNALRSLTA